jgi:hypothetical protein
VYDLLEELFPKLSWVELFARTKRDGWDLWGNQAPIDNADAAIAADAGTDVDGVDAETGDVVEADTEQKTRNKKSGKKRAKPEPKARVSESASTKKANAAKPRLIKKPSKAAKSSSDHASV